MCACERDWGREAEVSGRGERIQIKRGQEVRKAFFIKSMGQATQNPKLSSKHVMVASVKTIEGTGNWV